MANYVAGKVRQSDAASLTRCKGFLNQRYKMIWNEGLWRASLYRHDFTLQPSVPTTTELPFANQWCNAAGVQSLPSTVDRVLALRRQNAGLAVDVHENLFRTSLDEFEEDGEPVKFLVLPPAAVDMGRFTGAIIDLHAVTLESAAGDEGQQVRVKCIDTDGEEQVEAVVLVPSATSTMANSPLVILSATKGTTTGDVRFVWGDNADLLFTLAAADTAAKRYPRIQLLPKPTAQLDCKCLVKKKPTALTDDYDEPELTGVENCLMSFAQADMLQHARQYGKAMELQKEGLALLEQFKSMELIQQAHRRQVTPDVDVQSGDFEMSKAWYL